MSNGRISGIDGDQWAQRLKMRGWLWNAPENQADGGARGCLILAHGAGAPMDSDFMQDMAQRLAGQGLGVLRFEFPYMAQRRSGGGKRPPNPQAVLLDCWREVYREVRPLVAGPLVMGGKSMGGRMASLLADELGADALICLGYPFYAAGKPEKPRVAHLAQLRTPTLIIQGERDALGNRQTVEGYELSPAIEVCWLDAADHDLKPLKASGFSHADHLRTAAQRIVNYVGELPQGELASSK
ncbi:MULTISPECIES: alpha/beta family hydrolase [unclassified Pseudomonas]|uniref:alpha/beta family hydrolase n=1 Tax=unclassified Pseudomonas TaxID=196821 RepID=UPI000BA31B9D|nr:MULTISPECIES: alpha/beta family hydrolase [unclassified Pseudomonas]MCU1722990.1 alpha/beta hydrolase [Pseudomonas sp. 5P_5.1_Bac1]MCU1734835.1 alpha/beta hydrolase [Pseudomonas sp. 20P_3.2_Bac4]MCU1744388.1 alpha/beta hydrolase [Pseudomonas sp. 20P_3.2_Bac5]